jgi:hypothetical protein
MAITLRDRLPLLSDLAGVQLASLTPEAAKYRFLGAETTYGSLEIGWQLTG